MIQTDKRNGQLWLALGLLLALLLLMFAQKVTQLPFPSLDIAPKTITIDPKCPTEGQKEVIERNMKLYGAGFAEGYQNELFAQNLLAMAKTLGYPNPTMREINDVLRFLRKALKANCRGE